MKKVFVRVMICFLVIFVMPIKPVEVRAAVSSDATLNKNLDVNKDLVVDIKDLAMLAQYYNVNNKMSNWQDKYDFNGDGTIDIYDMTKMAKYINSSIAISNVTANVEQGKSYDLPQTVSAKIGDNYYVNLLVKWGSATVNTSKAGQYSYKGTIIDYNKEVTLTLNVEQPNNANINNYGFATFDGTWVYYGNPINEGKLSKAKIDGSSVTKINDDNAVFINVQGNYIYYCNTSDNYSIYKVNKDGTGRTKLTAQPSAYMRVYNNSIYYQKQNENYSLYKMNLDGSNNVKVTEDTPMYINLYEQYMYYSNYSNNAEITRVNLDNSSKINLSTTSAVNISVQDNYLFYQDYNDEFIYRMNVDGTNVTLVKAVKAVSLNAVNGWLYYINESDENTLHRVKYDGSTDEKLSEFSITNFNISGDRIFLYDEIGYLYSTKLDGTDLKIFGICTSILNIDDQNIQVGQGDYAELPKAVPAEMTDGSKLMLQVVWNSNAVDTSTKGTYQFKGVVQGYSREINLSVEVVEIGNSNGNLLHEGLVMEKNGWEYYADDTDGKLYKINADGTSKIKLSDSKVKYINVIGDWVYYEDVSDGNILYKVKTDGTLKTLVCSDSMNSLNIVGDWVFYSNSNDNNYLYKIKTDGTNKTKLSEEDVSNINVMGNWIYYKSVINGSEIYKINKDGYLRTLLCDYAGNFIVSGTNVYVENGSEITKMNLDGSNKIVLVADPYITDFNVQGNKIYYCDIEDYKLKGMNTDGTGRYLVSDYPINSTAPFSNVETKIHINGDWIYYTNYDNSIANYKMYKIKNNGTEEQRFGVDKTIKNIEQFSVSIKLGELYKLPSTIIATNDSGEKFDVPISWSISNIDTSKLGSTTYEGTVSGYNSKVQLTVTVVDKEIGGNPPNQDFVAQSGDWIVISKFKMKADGTEKGYYTDNCFLNESVSVVGDWAYYTDDVIKKVKIDGTGTTEICDDKAKMISILGDWIYYHNYNDYGKIYKIRLSGLDKTKVSDERIGEVEIAPDGWIYYEKKIDPTNLSKGEFWKMKTDGTGRVKLSDDTPTFINIVGDWIYYQSSYTTISKMKTDGSSKTLISNVTQPCNMKVVGDWIYLDNNYKLSKMKTDGSNASQIANMQTTRINVLNDWIYFGGSDGNNYRIRFDGSDKQLLY